MKPGKQQKDSVRPRKKQSKENKISSLQTPTGQLLQTTQRNVLLHVEVGEASCSHHGGSDFTAVDWVALALADDAAAEDGAGPDCASIAAVRSAMS